MKTGNGATPNPKGIWQKGMRTDTSNITKPTASVVFSAKRDPKRGKKNG